MRFMALPDEVKGLLLFLASTFFFASMDAVGKDLSQRYDPFQVVWARYLSQALIVALIVSPWLRSVLRTRQLGLQVLRSVFLFGATLSFFFAFSRMPLADATAIFEVAPLFVTALAALVLRERIGAQRWIGVAVGFIGALIIIRPGGEVFRPISLLPMLGAFFFSCYAISTRFLGREESAWTTFLYTAIFGAVVSSVLVPLVWTTPTREDAAIMVGMGAIGSVGQFLMIIAFRLAPASMLAPFTYVTLLFATMWGAVFFGDFPDKWTIAGAAVIVGSGLYVWRRQQLQSGE